MTAHIITAGTLKQYQPNWVSLYINNEHIGSYRSVKVAENIAKRRGCTEFTYSGN